MNELLSDKAEIDRVLAQGAEKARGIAGSCPQGRYGYYGLLVLRLRVASNCTTFRCYQPPSLQLDALAAAGCDKVFQDQVSGATVKRPGLDAALAALQPGDVLTVWRLDRLGRSMPQPCASASAVPVMTPRT